MIDEVDPATANTMITDGAVLLDVRTAEEFTAGHHPDAQFIPLDQLGARHGELPADRTIVVVCRSGARSARATEALTAGGYSAVNLAGGMKAWVAAGLPCVRDDGSEGSVA